MKNTCSQNAGFSLVEVVLAMGIAAVALVSLLGFLPLAMENSSDGADQTSIGLMLEDIHDRIEGAVLEVGDVQVLDANGNMAYESPFFYDQFGGYVDPNQDTAVQTSILTERFYRVEVEIVKPEIPSGSSGGQQAILLGDVLAVKVDLYWPLEDDGSARSPEEPRETISYFTAAKTGPGWLDTDSSYRPKIEY